MLLFGDLIKIEDFNIDDILLEEKSCGNILAYDISYKTLITAKLLPIRFDKVDGFIKVYGGIRYLILFVPEQYDAIYNRIMYLITRKEVLHILYLIIMQKSKLINVIPYLKKKMTLNIILIKSSFIKDQNH